MFSPKSNDFLLFVQNTKYHSIIRNTIRTIAPHTNFFTKETQRRHKGDTKETQRRHKRRHKRRHQGDTKGDTKKPRIITTRGSHKNQIQKLR